MLNPWAACRLVLVNVRFSVRTGRVAGASTAWLARVTATVLAQYDAAPEVARQLGQLLI
jgi:hypothetical protein